MDGLRINKAPAGAAAAAPPAVPDSWLGRLVKLVPSEIIALYLVGKGYAADWPGIWPVVCLVVLLIIRIFGTKAPGKGPQWASVLIAFISFIIWVYAIGGYIWHWQLPNTNLANLAVLVWTTVIPSIYKGD